MLAINQPLLNENHFEFHFQPEHIVLFQYEKSSAWTRNTWEYIRKNSNDIKRIQWNTKNFLNYIIIDIDNEKLFDFYDTNLPVPNFVIKNKNKSGGHLIYVLNRTISHEYYKNIWKKTYQYFNKILNGDPVAVGYIGKNPYNKHLFQYIEINPYSYNINDLYSFVDKSTTETIIIDNNINIIKNNLVKNTNKKTSTGRNVELFNELRIFAYAKILNSANDVDFRFNVQNKANQLNKLFNNPLDSKELLKICKSIIKYCLKNKKNIIEFKPKNKIEGLEGMNLKEKQKASANYSSAIKAEKNILLIKKTIQNLKADDLKINISNLVKFTKLSKPTIIKYKYLFQ